MDNLVIQIKNRPRDPSGRIGLMTRHHDKNFVSLQNGIQDRTMEIPRLGIISDPELSVTGLTASGLTVWHSAFECLSPYGIKCELQAGSVGLCPHLIGLTPRIDILAVDTLPIYDGDGEINFSGEVQVITGLTNSTNSYVPHLPNSWLKIGEVGISSGVCICTLRAYIPDKVPTPMAAPRVGLTDLMKVYVNPFRGHLACSNDRLDFTGGFSPLFEPPGVSGMQRIDLLVLNQNSELEIIHGSEILSPTRPSAPDYPAIQIPIAEVLLQDLDTRMYQDMISDVRPHFIWPPVVSFNETHWIPAGNFCCTCKGSSVAPSHAEIIDLFPALYFDDSIEESSFGSWRIPHLWNTVTGLTAIVSWANVNGLTCTSAVKWGIEYGCADFCAGISPLVNRAAGQSATMLCCTAGVTVAYARRDTGIGLCVSALTPGGIFGFRVYRDATDPEDTMLGDAALLGVAFEWEGYACVDRTIIYA